MVNGMHITVAAQHDGSNTEQGTRWRINELQVFRLLDAVSCDAFLRVVGLVFGKRRGGARDMSNADIALDGQVHFTEATLLLQHDCRPSLIFPPARSRMLQQGVTRLQQSLC